MSIELDLDEAATLVVAWRSGRAIHIRTVRAGGEVVRDLRTFAAAAAEIVNLGGGREYDPDDEQGDAPLLHIDRDELLDTQLLEEIHRGASAPLASPSDLTRKTISLYALVIGNDPGLRVAFIRRGNPLRLANKGLVAVFDESLTRVSSPILAFDSKYDVISTSDDIWALNKTNFEALFKDSEAVLAKADEWVSILSTHLPISAESKEGFAERLKSNSILRRKVHSLLKKSHLATITSDVLRENMFTHSLDADRLMPNGELIFNKENERDILLLLNEDLFKGDFSGENYAANTKARRA